MFPSARRKDWPRQASNLRSAARATVMTTPWQKPSTGCTRRKSSTGAAPGKRWNVLNWQPSNGWHGSTIKDYYPQLAISRQQKLRQNITASLPGRIRKLCNLHQMDSTKPGAIQEFMRNPLRIFSGTTGNLLTSHFSVAQVGELLDALNQITDENQRKNASLEMPFRGKAEPLQSSCTKKMGQVISDLTHCAIWRARSDSNARPHGS